MVLLYGAGGHACVVLDALQDLGIEVRGVFDDGARQGTFLGRPILGEYNSNLFGDDKLVITIGDNATRKRISQKVKHSYESVIAKTSMISSSSTLGFGNMILHKVIVQAYSKIGNHVILNTGSQIDHNCTIADYVHIAPGVVLCGDVTVGEGALIGAGAVVIPGIKIGKWSTIGAGSVVVRNVPEGSTWVGNPARELKSKSG